MKRFDRHFLWVFTQSFALVLALVTTVFLVVDVLLNLDKIRNFADVAPGVVKFYGYNLPPILYLLYPFAVFGAGMFAIARVIRARELLLLEASGISPRRALAAILVPCLALGGLGLVLRQFALPALGEAARESPYGAFEFRRGKRITVRDDQGNTWFVKRYNLDERALEDVRILHSSGTRLFVTRRMQWLEDRGIWWCSQESTLHDLEALTGADGSGSRVVYADGQPPFGRLLPADFARRKRGYADWTLTELWRGSNLQADNLDLRVTFWHELWYPLGGFILLACGAGLVAGRGERGMVRSGALALGCVVGYQLCLFWLENLASSGVLAPVVGAGIAPVLFGGLGAWVLFRR
ncbi:MAG: YjgP/YjgQ family permease [Planctomycetes bacterium]|nr:YjgP/YjgQ family permease [Planctomycetota bacterium]